MSALVLKFVNRNPKPKRRERRQVPIAVKAARLQRLRPFHGAAVERLIDKLLAECDYESPAGA